MLAVVCVLKSGGIYDASWVARLRDGVRRHLHLDYMFACLSDVDAPCRVPLEHNWDGWWSKIELFRHPGPILYFDLDTVIVGDITNIAVQAHSVNFYMLRDFYATDHCGSGVMGWGTSRPRSIYDSFAGDAERLMKVSRDRMGDQAFIEESFGVENISRWQDKVGDQIVSYKVHCRNGIPPNARVVCLHGYPKFGDMPVNDPVRVAWEMAA